jgi:heterodisulfide reductase subunit D
MSESFEAALSERVDAMVEACTRCGKCVEVCPVTGPGGVKAEPREVISGILDILRKGEGAEASRKWANACVLSGECIKACDYGVNPRFLLGMARVAMARKQDEPAQQRRQGVEGFRKVAREVTHLSRMQLDEILLARLGQKAVEPSAVAPDFVFYTGCNAQDAAHCASCPGHHGRAGHPL